MSKRNYLPILATLAVALLAASVCASQLSARNWPASGPASRASVARQLRVNFGAVSGRRLRAEPAWRTRQRGSGGIAPNGRSGDVRAVAGVLEDLHDAASKADGERYFSLFAPEAVFFGTDATERWPLEEFRRYASQRFEAGSGWTYHASRRHIYFSQDCRTAWFDEVLVNAKYGECRGTGVLVKRRSGWKIAQYNLSIPIPNEIALEVVGMIKKR